MVKMKSNNLEYHSGSFLSSDRYHRKGKQGLCAQCLNFAREERIVSEQQYCLHRGNRSWYSEVSGTSTFDSTK